MVHVWLMMITQRQQYAVFSIIFANLHAQPINMAPYRIINYSICNRYILCIFVNTAVVLQQQGSQLVDVWCIS